MSLFDILASIFSWSRSPPKPEREFADENSAESGFTITFTYTGPERPEVPITDEEVDEGLDPYRFVLDNEPQALNPANRWFDEKAQRRYLKSGSEKALSWLLPFISIDVAKLPQMESILEYGPNSSTMIAKEIRQVIRERRKAKQPYNDLLQSLYNACVMSDFSKSIAFENIFTHRMTPFVDIRDLQDIDIDYRTIGYKNIHELLKTDVKWLIEAFGEPTEHQPINSLWPDIRDKAIARFCWHELKEENESKKAINRPQLTMEEWLRNLVKENIRIRKVSEIYQVEAETKRAKKFQDIEAAWAATRMPFVVADLETTGLEVACSEILEIGALLVEPDGSITSELCFLVNARQQVPEEITRLTGITQSEVDRNGIPLAQALENFLNHIGDRPVFFHNAPFDQGFLDSACGKTNMEFKNSVYDTLTLARHTWPSLPSHKLRALSKHVGAPAPKHRALGDARATLAVLTAARAQMNDMPTL